MKTARRITLLLALAFATCFASAAADPPPANPADFIRRGSDQLIAGEINASIKSFEQAISLDPAARAHLWQLGIAYYYAGRFADGRALFELHQTVNPRDVENAAWHFLCLARLQSVEFARKNFIPISGDSRVPMKEVHALFAGTATSEDVLKAAAALESDRTRNNALCYAHLYLALFEEAQGHIEASRTHIQKAAEVFRQDHYMGKIARLHAKLRAAPEK